MAMIDDDYEDDTLSRPLMSRTLRVPMTDDELAAAKVVAYRDGESLSNLVRRLLRLEIDRRSEVVSGKVNAT